MIELAQCFNVDLIVHASITHYMPYQRPRLGLVVQAVSPVEAKVVASVDGLWDTTDIGLTQRIRTYYSTRAAA